MAEERNEQELSAEETAGTTGETPGATEPQDGTPVATEATEAEVTVLETPPGEEWPADIRCGSVSYVHTEEQHVTLLQLEQSFPHWPACQCSGAPPRYGHKWKAISSETQARFHNFAVTKESKLQSICSRARGRKELMELRQLKDAHKTCSVAVAELERRLEKKNQKHKKEQVQLMDANEHLQRKASDLAQQLEQTRQLLCEAEGRARMEQEQSIKTKERLRSRLNSVNRKAKYLEKCLKHAEQLMSDEDEYDSQSISNARQQPDSKLKQNR